MSVSLPQLRAFIAVSRYGSFTLAADALHRTQPAITLQVKKLEKSLGLRLVDRSTRQLRLTSVALELIPPLTALLDQLDGVLETSRKLRTGEVGVVRLGCLPSAAATYLPYRLAEFRRKHPGISFIVKDDLGEHVVAMVKAAEVEFGITDTPRASELEATPLFSEQMCALYPRNHPIESAKRIDVEELSKHSLILMARGSNARRLVDNAFARAGKQATPACEVSFMTSAVGLVRAGLGIALLPPSGFDLAKERRLSYRPITGAAFARHIALVKLKGRSLSPAAAAFVEGLIAR